MTIQEVERVVFEMFPDEAEKEKDSHIKNVIFIKLLPVVNKRGIERKLILIQDSLKSGKEWEGVAESTKQVILPRIQILTFLT